MKTQPKINPKPEDASQEACLPSEAVRQSLLKSLAAVRRRCDGPDAIPSDSENTKPLIDINSDAVSTTRLCAAAVPVAGPSPPTRKAAPSAPSGSCLSLERDNQVYVLTNAGCTGRKVIAVVEIKLSSGITKCRGHVVQTSQKLGTVMPNLNYECIENGSDCSMRSVKAIFPFCAW